MTKEQERESMEEALKELWRSSPKNWDLICSIYEKLEEKNND